MRSKDYGLVNVFMSADDQLIHKLLSAALHEESRKVSHYIHNLVDICLCCISPRKHRTKPIIVYSSCAALRWLL